MSVVGKTVGIFTLGCRVNQYESEAIAEALERAGVQVLHAPQIPCDGYLVHTCAVTAESSRKSRQFVRRALRQNPSAVVIVTGCEAERAATALAGISGVDAVVGNKEKLACVTRLLSLLENGKANVPDISVPSLNDATFEPMTITHAERTRAYVKIEDGCNGCCAYCIIASLRGPVRSKPIADVVDEVRTLVANGYREVVLTGIETSAYAFGLDTLCAALQEINGLSRIRLSSLDPASVTPAFAAALAACNKVMPHFHLSLQSGDSRTLARMRRRYTAEGAARAVAALSAVYPTLSLTADIIVGFPQETEAEFASTYDFLAALPLHAMHIFPFSPRPGTPAATMDAQIPEPVKAERLATLSKLADNLFAKTAARFVGCTVNVLFERVKNGIGEGHAESMIVVRAPAAEADIGNIIPVKITALGANYLEGLQEKEGRHATV